MPPKPAAPAPATRNLKPLRLRAASLPTAAALAAARRPVVPAPALANAANHARHHVALHAQG